MRCCVTPDGNGAVKKGVAMKVLKIVGVKVSETLCARCRALREATGRAVRRLSFSLSSGKNKRC